MVRADRIRPLNVPRPLRVEADARGFPLRIQLRAGWMEVTEIADRWRIDDEWWRKQVSRMYFQVRLAPDGGATIFHDLVSRDRWYLQPVAMSLDQSSDVVASKPAKRKAASPRRTRAA
jgi:hypothetical protein